jgi:hypothetical protein
MYRPTYIIVRKAIQIIYPVCDNDYISTKPNKHKQIHINVTYRNYNYGYIDANIRRAI